MAVLHGLRYPERLLYTVLVIRNETKIDLTGEATRERAFRFPRNQIYIVDIEPGLELL